MKILILTTRAKAQNIDKLLEAMDARARYFSAAVVAAVVC